ncbi:MAG: response regulator [Cohaesibacteraceae bacterium]|nr:response regulator [Cohaesibacteraceae bacterium]
MAKLKLSEDTAHEHIALFTKAPRMIYLGHIASAAVLIYLASAAAHVPGWFLVSWSLVELILTPFAMGWLAHSYNDDTTSWTVKSRWIAWLDGLFLFIGLSWGALLLISLNPDNPAHFSMQMAIVAGASAAAVKSLGLFPRTFALYAIPFLGLVSARLFLLGGDYILLGGLVVIFLVMLLGLSNDALISIKQYIAIKHQNLELADKYRIEAKRADYANREKTRLLAAASHDLRQPVHAIGLLLATLSTDKYSDQDCKTVTNIRQSIDTLSKLFNSVLDVSLLDAGKISVNPDDFLIHDFVTGIVSDLQPLAQITGATITTDVDESRVHCDPVLLRRIIQNLIANSITHGNGARISITTSVEAQKLSICVSDAGPGISKENQARVFDEFLQIDQNRFHPLVNEDNNQQKGLGLGLAIVKRLSTLMNINVHLQSDRSGTSFMLEPIDIIDSPQENEPVTTNATSTLLFDGQHVLIIDDDQQSGEALSHLLHKWGCQTSLGNSKDNQDIDSKPDLVICDYELESGINSLELVSQIQSRFGSDLKIIMVSAGRSPAVQQQIDNTDYLLLAKPVQPVQLRTALLNLFIPG